MFLSRIPLDGYKRDVMRALNSPSIFHGAIESSFSEKQKRNLWRIDNLNNQLYLLLLSETKPELTSFCEQFGYDNYEWESRPYDNFLEKIKNGDKLRFRITANPTKSEVSEKGSRGKVTALIITDEQKDWLMKKAEKNGFILTADSFDVMQKKQYRFYKKNSRTVTLTSVTFEGILTVSDADLVRNALEKGIGRGKAYGMGLLTVMRT